MNLNMSLNLKVEILNAVKKRNLMFAKWIDLCSTIAFLLLLVIALINATPLRLHVFGAGENILDAITIFTIVVSVCFDFIFKSDRHKENVVRVNEVLKESNNENIFEAEFMKLLDIVTELDIARARYDYCMHIKAQNQLYLQKLEDRLQPTDIVIMNRQRYIIVVLILEIILLVGMLVFTNQNTLLMYIIPSIMLLIGLIFMVLDAVGGKSAEKHVENIYK